MIAANETLVTKAMDPAAPPDILLSDWPGLLPLLSPEEIALAKPLADEGVRFAMSMLAGLNGPQPSDQDTIPIIDSALQLLGPLRSEALADDDLRMKAGPKDAAALDQFFGLGRVTGPSDQIFAYDALIVYRDLVNNLNAGSNLSPVERAHLRAAFAELAGLLTGGTIPTPGEAV